MTQKKAKAIKRVAKAMAEDHNKNGGEEVSVRRVYRQLKKAYKKSTLTPALMEVIREF